MSNFTSCVWGGIGLGWAIGVLFAAWIFPNAGIPRENILEFVTGVGIFGSAGGGAFGALFGVTK